MDDLHPRDEHTTDPEPTPLHGGRDPVADPGPCGDPVPDPEGLALVRQLAQAHLVDAALRVAHDAARTRAGGASQAQLRATTHALFQAACDFCTTYRHQEEWEPAGTPA